MKWTLPDPDSDALALAVHSAFDRSFSRLVQNEPQMVANLVWYLPSAVNQIRWTGRLKASMGAVFIHGQPLVTCKSFPKPKPKSVELGDILLVRTEKDRKGQVSERRAILFQAKLYDTPPVMPDNENQLHLYAQWPSFKYKKATKHLNGKQRRLAGNDTSAAARYLLVNSARTGSACECYCLEPFICGLTPCAAIG